MSTVFAKLCLRDFIRRRVCQVPSGAGDGLVIPKCLKIAPPLSPAEDELVWYFVLPTHRCRLY